jgi:hypothetical protein
MVRPVFGCTRSPMTRPASVRSPVSSLTSRTAASARLSSGSTSPAMNAHGGGSSMSGGPPRVVGGRHTLPGGHCSSYATEGPTADAMLSIWNRERPVGDTQ